MPISTTQIGITPISHQSISRWTKIAGPGMPGMPLIGTDISTARPANIKQSLFSSNPIFESYATICPHRRFARLPDGHSWRTTNSACRWPYPRRMPDRIDRLDARRESRRRGSVRGPAGHDSQRICDGIDRFNARGTDGRPDGTRRDDRGRLSPGFDRRVISIAFWKNQMGRE